MPAKSSYYPGADPCKVWINGFPRELLAEQLEAFGHQALFRFASSDVAAKCKIMAFHLSKAFTINFPTDSAAKDFLLATRDGCGEWSDPKGGRFPIASRQDRDISTRNIAKTIGDLWKSVHTHLSEAGTWKPGWQLRTTGARGTLFLSHDHDNTVLFRIKANKMGAATTHQIEPDYDCLAHMGINRSTADRFAADARTRFEDRP